MVGRSKTNQVSSQLSSSLLLSQGDILDAVKQDDDYLNEENDFDKVQPGNNN
jgi:hypothetical protein